MSTRSAHRDGEQGGEVNKPTRINVEDIRLDGGTQSRAELSDDVIQEYAGYYTDKVEMPPVVVYFDGTDRWLADGFHRVMAAKWAGRQAKTPPLTS